VNAALPRLGLIVALASLAACRTVGPDYALPEGSAFKRPEANAAFIDTQNPQVAANQALPDRWWSLYNDPVLDGLITQALRDNVELKAADAHLRRAAAVYEQALDAGGFEYEAEAGVSRAQLSAESFLQEHELPVINLADGKFAVSYQFDLFGKLKRGAEAARADEQSVAAARDLAQVSVVAQVADSYLEICHANHELHVAEHSLQLQQRSRTVTERLIAAGRGTPPELARANAQVALLEGALPPLRAQRSAAAYSLAALLGRPGPAAGRRDRLCARPSLAQPLPVGDGRALLQRRPDVRQAERKLASATARIGVATAELYPDIRLGASLGAAGLLEDFGTPMTQQWSIGPLISWTLPSSGTHARIHAAEAGADAALAEFDHTVLQALRETQTALDRYAQDLRRLQSLRIAQEQAALAAEQNRRLYQGGRTPYLSSLDADRSLATSDATLAAAEAQVSRDQIHLFLVLGGGWQASAAAPTASTAAK
jgi:NodT family efflux transporter outer membrane factor (OMF) lipoprotein